MSETDRRIVRETLLDIANADTDVANCNQSADEAAMLMDRMEDEDAKNS